MAAVEAYTQACEANDRKPRTYLVQTLEQIQEEMDGERRSGVIDLQGTAKPLFKSRLNDVDVTCFFEGLAVFQTSGFNCAEINLSRNRIGAIGAAKVADFIQSDNVRVGALNLAHNDIDTDGIQCVVELLRNRTTLSWLDVSCNEIGAKGAMNIVEALEENNTLAHLDIGGTGFESSCIIALCDMLRHRRNITLRSLGLSTPYVSKRSVPCHTVLEHIGLMLKHNHGISALDLTGHRIDDRGAEVLCAYLCTNGSVQSLVMPKNDVGFKGAAAFAALLVDKNCALVHLDLGRNNIATDGAVSIAQALARNNTLQTLDLSQNDIKDEGLLQIQTSVTNHPSLRRLLMFSGNHFGKKAAEYLESHPLHEKEHGGIKIDYKSFVVDGEVQIAQVAN